MILMNANYRRWVNGQKVSVPAPWDPGAAPGTPAWFNHIASLASGLAKAGYTDVLLPPFPKTQSGSLPTGDGYGMFDQYDLGSKNQCGSIGTRFGTREELLRMIAVCHANGLKVIADVVLHQMDGGQKDGVYRYVGADGKMPPMKGTLMTNPDGTTWTKWDSVGGGRFPKDQSCFASQNAAETIPPFVPMDPVWNSVGNFAFGSPVSVVNSLPKDYMAQGLIDACDWMMRTTGADRMRIDDVKGFYAPFIRRLLTSKTMADKWAFAELFDNADALWQWIWSSWSGIDGRCSGLDFDTHFHLQDVLDNGFPMSHLNGTGYAARDPMHAVTFVDSPDTDSSFAQQIVNSKLLAYAFILTCEGVPQIFYRDWAKDEACYGLGPSIDNLVWIAAKCASGPTITRYVDADCIVLNRTGSGGSPGLLTAINKNTWNEKTLTVDTGFWGDTHLRDLTGHHPDIWCDGTGRATFTIPSNAYGGGQSYLCFSWAGIAGSPITIQPRTTMQTFMGVTDLDIAPAPPLTQMPIERIWCAEKSLITISNAGDPALAFTITGPTGTLLTPAVPNIPEAGRVAFMTDAAGWQTIIVTNNSTTAIPFSIDVEYMAPQILTGEDF